MDKPVTAREKEILDLISRGFSTKEIATKLYISEETVKSHRRQLFLKLRAKNSPHMIERAFALGILVMSEDLTKSPL